MAAETKSCMGSSVGGGEEILGIVAIDGKVGGADADGQAGFAEHLLDSRFDIVQCGRCEVGEHDEEAVSATRNEIVLAAGAAQRGGDAIGAGAARIEPGDSALQDSQTAMGSADACDFGIKP